MLHVFRTMSASDFYYEKLESNHVTGSYFFEPAVLESLVSFKSFVPVFIATGTDGTMAGFGPPWWTPLLTPTTKALEASDPDSVCGRMQSPPARWLCWHATKAQLSSGAIVSCLEAARMSTETGLTCDDSCVCWRLGPAVTDSVRPGESISTRSGSGGRPRPQNRASRLLSLILPTSPWPAVTSSRKLNADTAPLDRSGTAWRWSSLSDVSWAVTGSIRRSPMPRSICPDMDRRCTSLWLCWGPDSRRSGDSARLSSPTSDAASTAGLCAWPDATAAVSPIPVWGCAGLYSCAMLEMPGMWAATSGAPPVMWRWWMPDAVVRGLGLRLGDVAAPGDGDGVRTSGESGLLCHDLRRLAAAGRVTVSLCFRPCRELGRPPTGIAIGEEVATAGEPGALDPGELLWDDEWAESDIHGSAVDWRRGTTVVGEPGILSPDDVDRRCGDSGDEVAVICCSAAFRLLSCRNRDARCRSYFGRRRCRDTGVCGICSWPYMSGPQTIPMPPTALGILRAPMRIDVLARGMVRRATLAPPVRISRTSSICSSPWTDVPLTWVMRSPADRPASIAGLFGSTAYK